LCSAFFAIDCDGCFWTNQGADAAAGAFVLDEMGRVKPSRGDDFRIQANDVLRASFYTQFTSLAKIFIYYNRSSKGHSKLL
jgi:hypothetical protein